MYSCLILWRRFQTVHLILYLLINFLYWTFIWWPYDATTISTLIQSSQQRKWNVSIVCWMNHLLFRSWFSHFWSCCYIICFPFLSSGSRNSWDKILQQYIFQTFFFLSLTVLTPLQLAVSFFFFSLVRMGAASLAHSRTLRQALQGGQRLKTSRLSRVNNFCFFSSFFGCETGSCAPVTVWRSVETIRRHSCDIN